MVEGMVGCLLVLFSLDCERGQAAAWARGVFEVDTRAVVWSESGEMEG